MSLYELKAARADMDNAKNQLNLNAKAAIDGALRRIFASNSSITSIQWAQKASEYNDEGMYPGVFGPVKNEPGPDEDFWPGWLDDWSDRETPRSAYEGMTELKEILRTLGEDILSEIFGDEARVMAVRTEDGFKIETEYQSY